MATVEPTASRSTSVPAVALTTGTVLLAGAMWTFGGGVVGALLGVAIGFVAAANGGHYGVGLAHLAALLVAQTPSIGGVVVLELASVAYLSSELRSVGRAWDVVLLVVGAGVSISLVTLLSASYGTPATAAILVGVTAVLGYALHRLGLYELGLLSEGAS